MRLSIFCLLLAICTNLASAQKGLGAWQPIQPSELVLPENARRTFEPLQYKAFALDFEQITAILYAAPMEFTSAAKQKNYVVTFPMADGTSEAFAMSEVTTMMPKLHANRREIRCYAGTSLTNVGKQIRITISPYRGFEGMILLPNKGVEYLEPLADGQIKYYMAYNRNDIPTGLFPTLPTKVLEGTYQEAAKQASGSAYVPETKQQDSPELKGGDVQLKVYRFACATTGEFGVDHGGTVAGTLAKVVATSNALNAIYERDLNIRLKLIEEEESIIFVDPNTDPYTGTTVFGWLDQNTLAMINILGSAAKYDIGHVLARYQGGDAIGVAGGQCCGQLKGRGCSAWYGPPYGDAFFAILGQEVGHQWAGGHTFNQCGEDSQFTYDSACEPGSGSTIMSYAGACGSNNIQNTTELYYHACSIVEIRDFVYNGEGNTCGTFLMTDNNNPIATALHPDNFFIPIKTPFTLKGSAIDPDGDPMTYCWDEIDLGPTSVLGTPVGSAPIFKWVLPDTSSSRTFPKLTSILSGISSITELLPTYTRDLTFAFVARDNRTNGGGIGMDTLSFKATGDAGPFVLTFPNASTVNWKVGEYQTITWDVSNTDKAPVNCKLVNIYLSVNNGSKFPILVAANVPNTGSYCIQVPNNVANTCRLKIEAADNIFFDISNSSFKITQATAPGFTFCNPGSASSLYCAPYSFTTEINTAATLGFADPITMSVTGLPTDASVNFTVNPVTPGSTTVMTITYANTQAEGVQDIVINGTSGALTSSHPLKLTVVRNFFNDFKLETPADGAGSVSLSPWLYWNGITDAASYDVQVASNPSFAPGTLLASGYGITKDSFKIPTFLSEGLTCYWRVRPNNECGSGNWPIPFAFVTKVENCATYNAGDLPKSISANGTPTVESKITVNAGGNISDINVKKIQGNHAYFKDLDVRLVAPNGSEVLLFKDKCGSYNGAFNLGFDDAANGPMGCPPSQSGVLFKPAEPIVGLTGQTATGAWILRVKDNVVSSGGQLAAFSLELCSSVALNPPLLVINNLLQLTPGTNAAITNTLLKAEDANTPVESLTFTLVSVPTKGQLERSSTILKVGDSFTQADLDNGNVRYFDYNTLEGDQFHFALTDGEGGLVTGIFKIAAFGVATKEPFRVLAFDVSPNPANDLIRVNLNETSTSDSRLVITDALGRSVLSQIMAKGSTQTQMDISALPSGFYTLSIENSEAKGVKKVIID